jgi:DNA-binding response OmpR family regulator
MMRRQAVLAVGDEAGTQLLLRAALAALDAELVVVAGLKEAASAAHAKVFDLVLLDIQLHDGSGLDSFRPLRETEGLKEALFLPLTGEVDPKAKLLAYGWGQTTQPSNLSMGWSSGRKWTPSFATAVRVGASASCTPARSG